MDRFSEVYRQYQKLQEDYQAGALDKDTFQRSVEGLSFTDDQGQSWQIGVASGEWYRLQEGDWIKDTPPTPEPAIPAAVPAMPETQPPPPPAPTAAVPPPPPPASSFDETPQFDFGESDLQPQKKKKKKRRGCLIIGLILVVVIACLGAIYVGNLILNDGDDLLYEFESSSWLGGNNTYIDIDNQTSFEICAVYISPSTSDEWGSNWLSGNESIPPYSVFSFKVEIGETMDVLAEDCQGDTMDILYDITIPEEGVTITYSPN